MYIYGLIFYRIHIKLCLTLYQNLKLKKLQTLLQILCLSLPKQKRKNPINIRPAFIAGHYILAASHQQQPDWSSSQRQDLQLRIWSRAFQTRFLCSRARSLCHGCWLFRVHSTLDFWWSHTFPTLSAIAAAPFGLLCSHDRGTGCRHARVCVQSQTCGQLLDAQLDTGVRRESRLAPGDQRLQGAAAGSGRNGRYTTLGGGCQKQRLLLGLTMKASQQ